jgi:hypothetical protein
MIPLWGTSTAPNPTLSLDFVGATSLDAGITFSRGSQATLFDSTGALVYAKHNLLLQSQTFDNASWTKTRSSVTQDTAVAPDGTTTADSLVEDGTAANTHDLRQSVTNTGTNTWALSVYLKAVNRSWAAIELQNATATSNRARAWFDLQNGVVGTGNTAGSGVTYVSHSIQNVGNDWYRCILVGTADSAVTSVQAWLEGTTADNLQNYNGVNGQTSVYIWGAQLNLTAMEGGVTSSLSTYYPTVASAYYAPRFDYNPSTLAAQGLLIEEQRTNSIRNNTMQGAVAGTPGTLPTNWAVSNLGTLATAVIGTGTENGITYIDLKISGTTSTTGGQINFEAITATAAAVSQTWTHSTYCTLAAGSMTNVTSIGVNIGEYDVGSSFLAQGSQTFTPTAANLNVSRRTLTRTLSNASTAYIRPWIAVNFSSGVAIDITLRIGLPQLEIGPAATAVNATSGTAYYAPRFDYNPSTLAAQGLLIEEQRTNSIRNNTMQGAVAGTPGTAPTNWSRSASPTSGISNEIVGTGTESGITYIDLRFTGTATATISFNINLETTTQVAASPSQTWAVSTYVKLTAGVLNSATFSFTVGEYSSVPAFLRNNFSSTTTPTSAGLATQRVAYLFTTGASTASIQPQISVNLTNGLTYDFTLRIGLPQLEQGAFATSVIPTTTTALTRNADVASMTGTNFSSWYNASEGTLFSEVALNGLSTTANQNAWQLSDGTTSNRVALYRQSAAISTGLSFGTTINGASWTTTAIRKIALGNKSGDSALADSGAIAGTGTGTTVQNVNQSRFGSNHDGTGGFLNGYIRRIAYYPVRLPNSTLQALTA